MKIYNDELNKFNEYLSEYNSTFVRYPQEITEAMQYSLMAGGKRLRPLLCILANKLAGGNGACAYPFALALEMIHTFSLIHDDLPSLDNDEYRRGKLTNHMVYGEAIAILAGDGLINQAYEIMIDETKKNLDKARNYIQSMDVIAKSVGVEGMLGGQVVDTLSENNPDIDEETLMYIHTHKTGALIVSSLLSGLYLVCMDNVKVSAIIEYGKNIGLVFQIIDDILDVTGDFEELGKKPGSDEKLNKSTYPQRYGLEKSKIIAKEYTSKAKEALDVFDDCDAKTALAELAEFLLNRKK